MELIANEGYWLTQKVLENEANRGFWKRLYPAHSLSAEDFDQWTDAQKAEWEATPHEDEEISDSEALRIITEGE